MQLLKMAANGWKDVILYGGAVRGGKTFAALGALIVLCRMYNGSKWAVVRTDMPTLKKTTIPSFLKICPPHYIISFNRETNVVTLYNGSQIIFFAEGYDYDKDLNRWRGLEVNGFLLEEANELTEKAFNKAIERSGLHFIADQPKPLIICTCNPTQNWVKEKFYVPWKENRLNPRWAFIPAKITDNPYADEDYKAQLKNLPRYEYQIFVEGEWDLLLKTGVEFYREFNMEKHVRRLTYDARLPIWLSVDENVHPYFGASVWQVQGKRAMQIDELCMKPPLNTVRDLVMEFKQRYPNHQGGLLLTGDATSKKQDVKTNGYNLYTLLQNGLREYHPQLKVPPGNPEVYMRGQFINGIFFNNFDGIEIIIGDNCKNTILDLQNVKQDADDTKLKTTIKDADTGVSYQQWGHLSDCLDYAVTSIFALEFGHFKSGGRGFIPFSGKVVPKQSW